MRVLGADLATRTGWAVADAGVLQACGHLDFSNGKSRGEKLSLAGVAFRNLLAATQPEAVLLEAPFSRGVATTRLLYGYAAALEAASHDAGLPCLEMAPSEVRKRVLGAGNADKSDVLAWARGHLTLEDHQTDEADAALLAWCGMQTMRHSEPKRRRRAV